MVKALARQKRDNKWRYVLQDVLNKTRELRCDFNG